jgi:hypothetical protein
MELTATIVEPVGSGAEKIQSPFTVRFVISGAKNASPIAWSLSRDGVEISGGNGRPPATFDSEFESIPANDPIFELTTKFSNGGVIVSTILVIPESARTSRPVAQLSVASAEVLSVIASVPAPRPSPLNGSLKVTFDPTQSYMTRGGELRSWRLDFGDGTFAQGDGAPQTAIQHTYQSGTATRIIYVATLTVSGSFAQKNSESLPASLMVGVEPVSRPAQALEVIPTLVFTSADGLGNALFAAGILDTGSVATPAIAKWELTVNGAVVKSGMGSPPTEIGHIFTSEPVAKSVVVTLRLTAEKTGAVSSAQLIVELVPVDPPKQRSLPADRTVGTKTAARKDDSDDGLIL